MELPKIGKSDKGMFDGIKSKLGFGGNDSAYNDEYYDDYADDYGEGYEEDYGEYGADYGDGYGYSDRSSADARPSRGGAHSASSPHLVSIDDVRANTQVPESLKRDPLPPRHASSDASASRSSGTGYRSSYGSSRQVERAADYLRSTETSDLPTSAQRAAEARSEGLNSLFTSTATAGASTSTSSSTYDPYEAYAGSGAASHNPTRSLSVLKPVSYGEVERVAKIIKAGDVVVLSLRNTPDHLAKRILDFSFGVSSALDASVECVADKVFVILRGAALSSDELTALRNQGVL